MLHLGQLYESGRGVERDPVRARQLFRRASGLEDLGVDFVADAPPADPGLERALAQRDREIEQLRRQLEEQEARRRAEVRRLEEQLDRAAEIASDGAARQLLELRREIELQRAAAGEARRELQRVREELGERSAEAADLDRLRERLERRRADAETSREALERLRRELAERERAAASGRAELEALRADLERARRELEQAETARRAPLAEPAELPGPTIQIIEPSLVGLTRGIRVVDAAQNPDAERAPRRTEVLVGRVEAPAGLVSLIVAGSEIEPNPDGIFKTRLPVRSAETEVELVAIDARGKRSARRIIIPGESQPAPSPARRAVPEPGIDFGRFRALVIGNDDYPHLPDLDSARADARAIAQLLEERYRFEVTLLENASRYAILSTLNRLRAELEERDNLLIYYAGHGELDRANMRGHWLPVDAERDSSANWISNVAITDILNVMAARHVLVIADSCYSGALTRSSLAQLDPAMSDSVRSAWQRAMVEKRSRTALTSGGLAPVLDAGGGNHSVFARALLDVLESNTQILEGQRLFQELAARVTWAAERLRFEQVPQYAPIKFSGHESGDFFLVPHS